MRTRWHKWWLLALLVSACGLNPHPDIPAGRPSGSGGTSSGGNSGVFVPPSGGLGAEGPDTAGGGLNVGNGGGAQGAFAGDSGMGEAGAADGGEGGAAGEGAAAAGGAAGADQLAPGPAR